MSFRDIVARAALAGAVIGGISYMAIWSAPLPHSLVTAWKGTGVGLLAVYAGLQARSTDGWLIAAVMGLCALGDVLLDVLGLTRGALAFLAGHLTAVALYARNLRPGLAAGDKLFAAALGPAIVATAFLLPTDRSAAPGIALYASGLSAMAAAAWLSRFPRAVTGLGAIMFAASDLLIFARIGPLAGQPWVSYGVWILYFGGQAMICLSVVRNLEVSGSRPASEPAAA